MAESNLRPIIIGLLLMSLPMAWMAYQRLILPFPHSIIDLTLWGVGGMIYLFGILLVLHPWVSKEKAYRS